MGAGVSGGLGVDGLRAIPPGIESLFPF